MHRFLLITLGFLLFAALPVSAGLFLVSGPFLVYDPSTSSDKVDLYKVELNGQVVVNVKPDPTGQYGFKYDLTGKPDGSYTVRAKSHDSDGWSSWCPPYPFSLPHNQPSK